MLDWNELHPFNAVHVVRVPAALDLPRLRETIQTTLEALGLTNLSVDPARSTGPAVFVGGWALMQLWLFWVAPIAGAAVAGVVHRQIFEDTPRK